MVLERQGQRDASSGSVYRTPASIWPLALVIDRLVPERIGLQPGSDFFIDYLSRQYHVPPDSFHIVRAGFTPDILLSGAVDYYGAFIVNQPRIIERAGPSTCADALFFPLPARH